MNAPADNRPESAQLLPRCPRCGFSVDPARDTGDVADMLAPIEPLSPGGPWYHQGCRADEQHEDQRDHADNKYGA